MADVIKGAIQKRGLDKYFNFKTPEEEAILSSFKTMVADVGGGGHPTKQQSLYRRSLLSSVVPSDAAEKELIRPLSRYLGVSRKSISIASLHRRLLEAVRLIYSQK